MNIYKYVNLDNDDILLEKIIIDTTNYHSINQENGNILLRKNKIINNIDDLKTIDFTKSNIIECTINNIPFYKLKYKSILEQIYNNINDGTIIIKNTKLNIKTIKKEDEGFYYLDNIGINIQGVDSNKCIYEICNQCINNNITISLKIKLNNGTIINIII
jgi:hypothetical protein